MRITTSDALRLLKPPSFSTPELTEARFGGQSSEEELLCGYKVTITQSTGLPASLLDEVICREQIIPDFKSLLGALGKEALYSPNEGENWKHVIFWRTPCSMDVEGSQKISIWYDAASPIGDPSGISMQGTGYIHPNNLENGSDLVFVFPDNFQRGQVGHADIHSFLDGESGKALQSQVGDAA